MKKQNSNLCWVALFLCFNFFGFLANADKAVFAGGCFWCMQPPFDNLIGKGVIAARVGYSGGELKNPTYQQVSAGQSGHIEVIEVEYDAKKISYTELLNVFWLNIDPYDKQGQFCDKGNQYVSAVFYSNDAEKSAFEQTRDAHLKLGHLKGEIATQALPAKPFYNGEDYHQSYYKKNPIRYKFYRGGCGRDDRLKKVWGTLSVAH
jgi:peptide-methionine (S)-S-oxide reductase